MTGRILVLDDDPLLALDVGTTLEEGGFGLFGLCHSVREAEAMLADDTPDAAVLDVNLGRGETSLPVAQRLRELGVPFVLLSGYEPSAFPPELQSAQRMAKPFRPQELLRTVGEMLG
ncbi:response regulator [Marinovum sp.]|uniref:response regulator n=1 Tax=Marinovum sp. TaxID=2024839 RepID=UPI002B2664AB|nr:response regulator [Marinovum sp.]